MASSTSALMQQYAQLRLQSADALLFFRLGDFYELFADDAILVSKTLGLTLTQRNGTPMCGVPHHASENYIIRLVQLGYKVALAEQVSKPEKGLAERAIVEVITPATALTRGGGFSSPDANYMLSFYLYKQHLAFCLLDVSTGDFIFQVGEVINWQSLMIEVLQRYSVSEIITSSELWGSATILKSFVEERRILVNQQDHWHFESSEASHILREQLGVHNLEGFGLEQYSAYVGVASVLLLYAKAQLNQPLPHIKAIRLAVSDEYLWMDESSFRNLEIMHNTHDRGESHTLFSVLNHTCTVLGRRKLRQYLSNPIQDLQKIQGRLEQIEYWYNRADILQDLRSSLKQVQDLERLATRVMLARANPKDLIAIAKTLQQWLQIYPLLGTDNRWSDPNRLIAVQSIIDMVMLQLKEEPSIDWQSGNVIRSGWNSELDQWRDLAENSREKLEEYTQLERERTGVTIRLKENRVIGWFFEVNKSQVEKLDSGFIKRQSVMSGERYTTDKLLYLEKSILQAREEVVGLERTLFLALREELSHHFELLMMIAQMIADIDYYSSLALLALQYGYHRPQFITDNRLEIQAGRHPVVERLALDRVFVPNDIIIDHGSPLLLITGPNMAGKSTYLRMIALITYMAHVGMFVPAKMVRLPLRDKIFCRVGASDNLSRGESTFLVEMNETARILNYATTKSLVIIDEVGRGTGSDDGLAIARAIMEHLALKIRCFTLFATHYHELTALECVGYKNYSLKVVEEHGEIFFTNEVMAGAASGSYGIHVAKMAGLPREVLLQAERYLASLLASASQHRAIYQDLPLFYQEKKQNVVVDSMISISSLEEKLLTFDLNRHTPLEVMQWVASLQEELGNEQSEN
ncbi:DNA mismatch repair protein MutS [Entomospira entomophila]|uniref:DNA mismatch repair protein MutS n=1 Tax=Entomospira entomophila TaxID=2719988 RepID=A0A968KRX2_9SPIO|nr:DNA mismatch repair protein MutS [Entomospira entomophilus]NIZ41203.1 DNA mismatch repair protein MutS [Entomospira entomophilus]WDI35409.1 DNA mismatch repair protein MutS [Entomospira entomophilus]